MLNKAILLATTYHAGQYDRGGNPYILHPLKVMHYLKTEDEEAQTKLAKQAFDLALLSQGMLTGKDLTAFVKRSVELI